MFNSEDLVLIKVLRQERPLFQDNLNKWAPVRQTDLDFYEARDDGVTVASAGPHDYRTICKSFAPRSRQIAMPASCHSIFYRPDALPDAQPAVSVHK